MARYPFSFFAAVRNTLLGCSLLGIAMLVACNHSSQHNETPPPTQTVRPVPQDSTALHVFVGRLNTCEPKDGKTIGASEQAQISISVLASIYGSNTPPLLTCDVAGASTITELSRARQALFFIVKKDSKPTFELIPSHAVEVYPTADGTWACLYQAHDFDHPFAPQTNIQPTRIAFREAVMFEATEENAVDFPSPFYRQKHHVFYAEFGLTAASYFQLKKQTTLRAMGMF